MFDVGEDFLLLVVDPSRKRCIPGGGAELFVERYLRSCKKGDGALFILCRWERKLPWFVRNCVIEGFRSLSSPIRIRKEASKK